MASRRPLIFFYGVPLLKQSNKSIPIFIFKLLKAIKLLAVLCFTMSIEFFGVMIGFVKPPQALYTILTHCHALNLNLKILKA